MTALPTSTAIAFSSTLSPSVLVLRLLAPSLFFSCPLSITFIYKSNYQIWYWHIKYLKLLSTFLISQPSSDLTQSSPGPLQSSPIKGIMITCMSESQLSGGRLSPIITEMIFKTVSCCQADSFHHVDCSSTKQVMINHESLLTSESWVSWKLRVHLCSSVTVVADESA